MNDRRMVNAPHTAFVAVINRADGRIERRDVSDHIDVILRTGTSLEEAKAMIERMLRYIVPLSTVRVEAGE